MITVVTEAIFSYCGVKVKIDTDRHLGAESAVVRAQGEAIGQVMTSEYGSQMLSLGGVDHFTGGTKAEGRVTCDALLRLTNGEAVELNVDGGSSVIVQAGQPADCRWPDRAAHAGLVVGRPRSVCSRPNGWGWWTKLWWWMTTSPASSANIRRARNWVGKALVLRLLAADRRRGGILGVAGPGLGWGGTNIDDPLKILGDWNAKKGRGTGVATADGIHHWRTVCLFRLNDGLEPVAKPFPDALRPTVNLIEEKLRTGALFRPVYGRCWWFITFRRHPEPNPADPSVKRKHHRHLRRRTGLRVAGRRHHGNGGCVEHAGTRVWLCANSGACGTVGIHHGTG